MYPFWEYRVSTRRKSHSICAQDVFPHLDALMVYAQRVCLRKASGCFKAVGKTGVLEIAVQCKILQQGVLD